MEHLLVTFNFLDKSDLKLRVEKCTLRIDTVDFLDHIIYTGGVNSDPKNVEAASDAPSPVIEDMFESSLSSWYTITALSANFQGS